MTPRGQKPQAMPGGAPLFLRLFTRLGLQERPPRFVVEYFPYANLAHTIRLREDTAYVRLSDLLRRAPGPVIEAAAALLLARLYRKKAPPGAAEAYLQFAHAQETRQRVLWARRKRARRAESGPRGRAFDLEQLFARLNRCYFKGTLREPHLGWSTRVWRRQLGCFDPGLDQIVLNRRLDRAGVPRYVVEYVLYHEMLHVKHPIRRASCGLQSHSPEFRREEKQFTEYERARRYLARSA